MNELEWSGVEQVEGADFCVYNTECSGFIIFKEFSD